MSKLDELMKSVGILDRDKLNTDIEVLRRTSENYLEAIIEYCESNNLEVNTIKSLLSTQIVSKLTVEMQDLHLIDPVITSRILY